MNVVDIVPQDVIAEAIEGRRHLHRNPELAYQETKTSEFISAKLAAYGYAVHRGLGGTGVVGTLKRGNGGRAIGIRADMDALRIQERTSVAYRSDADGIMHACGHDGHVAMALAAARTCASLSDLNGTVHFIFQPAEEGGAGARRMIEDGLFKLFPCDSVYAVHNWPALPLGTCVVLDGPMMAANAVIEVIIAGRGCHGAMPHEGSDCVLAGSQLVTAIQSIVSRGVAPTDVAVLSITQIHAGDTHNVIPDSCTLRGTARWFKSDVGDRIERRLMELATSIAAGFNCEARVTFDRRYPATVNDPRAAAFVRSVLSRSPLGLSLLDASPSTGAEDFAFMLQAVPGCYIWLGGGKASHRYGLHSPYYDFNDELLPYGAALWVTLIKHSLT
jgi:hippurate hydrolase